MGFLQSPMALIRILKDKDAVDSSSLQQTAQWFMSGEGRAAYTAANTLLKKTEYFFDYLQLLVVFLILPIAFYMLFLLV